MAICFSLCVALRSHVRPLTNTTSLNHTTQTHTLHNTGTFLSRADVARMRHIWLSSPDQGGDIRHKQE